MGFRDKIWLEFKKVYSLEIFLFKFIAMNEGKKEKIIFNWKFVLERLRLYIWINWD